jgi:hypothetical protein
VKLSPGQKNKVRSLRSKGFTYAEIQKDLRLTIPKSSLAYICKGVKVPALYAERALAKNREQLVVARELAMVRNREIQRRRLEALKAKAMQTLSSLDKGSLKIALAMLYLGEGSKWASYRGLRLGNANPTIICLYIHLLSRCFGITINSLRARVQHRADQNAEELVSYWSEVTGIPQEQFYASYADERTQGKPTKRSDYRGVCVIMCPSTEAQLELAVIAEQLLDRVQK